jgi:RNA polymerase sigma-70 factor (ECF subfamily)
VSIATTTLGYWPQAISGRAARVRPGPTERSLGQSLPRAVRIAARRQHRGYRPNADLRDEGIEKLYTLRSMDLEQPSTEELVGRALALFGTAEGDRLVNELFERHYSRVACWCLRFTGDKNLAADLAQEIFARAHRNLKSFQSQSKFSTWLYAIARNQCLNAMKARSLRPLEEGEEALAELPGDDSSTAHERESSGKLVQQLLNEALDETEKKVFTLHYGDELTLSAITRLLGLTNVSGAKAYIVSAKRKLNRCLQRWKAREQRTVLESESS